MIIRKPYAFLIKNFRKIHIVLLLVGLFVFYRTFDTFNFVNRFMKSGIYDLFADPVTKHVTFWMNIGIYLIIIGSIALLFLLLHKKKPWKIYAFPILTYTVLLFILGIIKSFFRTYTEVVDAANLRLARDLLLMILAGQLPSLLIFAMRFLGLDFKKFDFNSDKEFLELSEEDREEVEVSLNFDIHTFKRIIKRTIRNTKYFYIEHKLITWIVGAVLFVVILYNSYVTLFVTNKTYRQGQIYKANGYTIKVENSYYTDKDMAGNVISKDSSFVIVEYTITNNSAPREFDTTNFHIRADNLDYSTTETTYEKEFADLGKPYKKLKNINRGETIHFIIIYKVSNKIKKNRFVLYYQEKGGINKLRRIDLKIKDISSIDNTIDVELGDFFEVYDKGEEENLTIESFKYIDNAIYSVNKCNSYGCSIEEQKTEALKDEKILDITFASDSFDAKNMIDFFNKYGRINYKDSKGNEKMLDVKIAVNKAYLGKHIYLRVPDILETYEEVYINFVVRNKNYRYKLS